MSREREGDSESGGANAFLGAQRVSVWRPTGGSRFLSVCFAGRADTF